VIRICKATLTWAVVLMATCLGATSALAAAVEQRCTELGSACLCSEPLRYTSGGTLRENVDPPDSEGPGAKECGNGSPALDAEPTGMQIVTETANDFPGSNPPAYVLKMRSTTNDGDNSWMIYGSLPTNVRNETICSRNYQRFGSDLPIARDPNMRIKLQEAQVGGVLIQHELQHYSQGNLGINYNCNQDGSVNVQLAGRSSWIRFESCYDVGTSSVSTRLKATVVDTGQSDQISCGPKSLSTPANFTLYQIGNLFLQTLGDSSVIGSRYVTHAIQTRTPLNASFWPGPASELESGGGGSPPPSEPPPTEPLGKPGQPTYVP
jgi:hypothetical protein